MGVYNIKEISTRRLRKHDWVWYSDLVDKCSNPFCKSKTQLEVHHIKPLYCGGKDTMDNCIVLCKDCHRGLNFHSEWDYYQAVLLNWKIKIDNILDKIPKKYRKDITDAGLVFNYKLVNLHEDVKMNSGWGLTDNQIAREKAYQKLSLNKNKTRENEYEKCKSGYNQLCIDYEFYHSLIESQISGLW